MYEDSNAGMDYRAPIKRLVRLIGALALINVLLIASGVLLRPNSAAGVFQMLGVIAPISVQLGYWLLWRSAFWAKVPHSRRVWRLSSLFGFAAGFVFSSEILLEYIILPDAALNVRLGWIEFGTVFVLFATSAFYSSLTTGSLRTGLRVSAAAAMISSQIWVTTLWVATYAFWRTIRQESVFRVEGDYEDFARSGMHDFSSFTLQDLRGASFFHSVLGPLIALIVGFVAAGLAMLLRRIHMPTSSRGEQ
jgi:hypothetical protein